VYFQFVIAVLKLQLLRVFNFVLNHQFEANHTSQPLGTAIERIWHDCSWFYYLQFYLVIIWYFYHFFKIL